MVRRFQAAGDVLGTQMTVERRAFSGSVVTGLAVVVQFGQAIVLVPLFLSRWGTEKYGLWLGLLAAQALIITLDAGHQAFVGNEIARLYPVDRAQMRRVLASAIWVALLIGATEVAIGSALWLGGALPALLGTTGINVQAHHLAPALMAYLVMWALVGSVGGVLVRVLPPAGRYARSAAWGVASQLMLLVVWAGGLLAGASILVLTICQVSAQLLFSLALFRDLKQVCAEVYPFWSPADLRLGVRNVAHSVVLTGTNILTQLQQNGLNLLVTGLFGPALLPALTTARTLANVFMQGTNVVAAPLSPDIVRYHVKREGDKLVGAWAGIWFVGGTLINTGLVVSLVIVQPFYSMWTRGRMALDWSLFLPLVAAVSVKAFAVPLMTYLTGLNHLRGLATLAAIQGAIVVGGAWLMAGSLGLPGATIAILLAEVAGCATLIVFVRTVLREHRMRFPWAELRVASLPPLVSCLTFGAAFWLPANRVALVAGGLAALGATVFLQWRRLPEAVKTRMLGLVLRRPSP